MPRPLGVVPRHAAVMPHGGIIVPGVRVRVVAPVRDRDGRATRPTPGPRTVNTEPVFTLSMVVGKREINMVE